MSRLIVKNLPKGLKEERLRKHFGEAGQITDCALKYTRDGVFRKFAFIGFKTEQEAQAALQKFNKTFMDASKIQVEIARDFGDMDKPRAWSKYSSESSQKQKNEAKKQADGDTSKKKKKEKKKKTNNPVVEELLGDLKNDPKFDEFLNAHQNVGVKAIWTNDMAGSEHKRDNQDSGLDTSKSDLPFDDGDSDSEEEMEVNTANQDDKTSVETPAEDASKEAAKKDLSDLDYLKSKIGDQQLLSDSSSDSESEEEEGKTTPQNKKKGDQPKNPGKGKVDKEGEPVLYMVKLKGLPTNAGEKALKEFFQPLQIARLRIPKNAKKKPLGVAYISFKTEKEVEQALMRNKSFIGGKRIFVKKSGADERYETLDSVNDQPRPWEQKQKELAECEGIAETGRLFVRNLAYTCTEEDLEAEFKKYGPLTEVNMPIDSLTKKVKGFALVTFMIPEHAVKAYTELDGKVFQGRMLHILPGKERKEDTEESKEGSSFKKQKQAKQKASAGSSHNWNTLFLGANAVADVLAEKYQTSKSDILDTDNRGSLGVRMALGETQVVSETRDFLIESGVSLDSFSQPNAERSKTVILVKNLPAKTQVLDIEAVFSKHGTLGRVLLPLSGVTAIVEFVAPAEARTAFRKLAYTKFQHVPLYLEWAPMEVFTSPPPPGTAGKEAVKEEEKQEMEVKQEPSKPAKTTEELKSKESSSDDDEDDAPGSVLFVKNLNFSTRNEALKQLFEGCSKVKAASVALKKDLKRPGELLSLGYGFVEFRDVGGAAKAVREMQHVNLDGHSLELKISNRTTASDNKKVEKKKKQVEKKQKTTKILVRNIPFEAKKKEVEELFKVFGELKTVRLPKKMSGTGSHRGFGFVDFLTRHDAKRAFESLCHSTHLYGRRLVLEWAEMEEDIEDIRKRTAEHFHDDGGKKKFTKNNLKETLEMTGE